jgi:hypothetical protein
MTDFIGCTEIAGSRGGHADDAGRQDAAPGQGWKGTQVLPAAFNFRKVRKLGKLSACVAVSVPVL